LGTVCRTSLYREIAESPLCKKIDIVAPRVHDLHKLAMKCSLEMTEEQMDTLQYITLFNIEARYGEYKREFYRKCSQDFAEQNVKTIEGLRKWLLEKINS
jgi:HEPN domain-containing protein